MFELKFQFAVPDPLFIEELIDLGAYSRQNLLSLGLQVEPLDAVDRHDEYTRECLAIRADRQIRSSDVVETLVELMVIRGVPDHIRSDSGPEFIAQGCSGVLGRVGARTPYIEPGSPCENGWMTPRARRKPEYRQFRREQLRAILRQPIRKS